MMSLNEHPCRCKGRFNASQKGCEFRQIAVMLGASPPHAFTGRKTPASPYLLLPLVPGFGMVNDRIPIKHRVWTVIVEFAGRFFRRPSRATLFVDRSENYIRVSCTTRILPDDITRILANFESQLSRMDLSGMLRNTASSDSLARFRMSSVW